MAQFLAPDFSRNHTQYVFITTLLLLCSHFIALPAEALDRRGRIGIGLSNEFSHNIPALSFKLQRSRSFALGGVAALDTTNSGGYGAGIKLYRNLFEEPQLNFYTAGLIALINQKNHKSGSDSGFQIDWLFGSEFSFSGLSSLGFSFEFGISLNKLDEFRAQTKGEHFITSSVHFYL